MITINIDTLYIISTIEFFNNLRISRKTVGIDKIPRCSPVHSLGYAVSIAVVNNSNCAIVDADYPVLEIISVNVTA